MATPPNVEWTPNTVRRAHHVRCTLPEPLLCVGAGCAVSFPVGPKSQKGGQTCRM
jgi:hypothetical protein